MNVHVSSVNIECCMKQNLTEIILIKHTVVSLTLQPGMYIFQTYAVAVYVKIVLALDLWFGCAFFDLYVFRMLITSKT